MCSVRTSDKTLFFFTRIFCELCDDAFMLRRFWLDLFLDVASINCDTVVFESKGDATFKIMLALTTTELRSEGAVFQYPLALATSLFVAVVTKNIELVFVDERIFQIIDDGILEGYLAVKLVVCNLDVLKESVSDIQLFKTLQAELCVVKRTVQLKSVA